MNPDKPDIRRDLRRVAKWSAAIGFVLGVVCPHMPERYQAPCAAVRAVISTCTGVSP